MENTVYCRQTAYEVDIYRTAVIRCMKKYSIFV
jgi:hypothetical protein